MNTFELAVKTKQLPSKIEDLVPMSFLGKAAVSFYKEKLKLFDALGDRMNLSEEQRKITLKDGQEAGIMLLEIEGKIGELSKEIPQERVGGVERHAHLKSGKPPKHEKLGLKVREQLTRKQMIANYPKEKEEVIKEAIANDDIPTPTAVINKIKLNNYMKKHPAVDRMAPDISEITLWIFNKLTEVWLKLKEVVKHKENLSAQTRKDLIEAIDRLIKIKEVLK
jgi:hypothetical protein